MYNHEYGYDDDEDTLRWMRKQFSLFRLEQAFLQLAMQADPDEMIDLKKLPAAGTVTHTMDGLLQVKAADDSSGLVRGYLSTWDLDLGNDRITPGAYTKTIGTASATAQRHGAAALWPLLWQHQRDEPIGGIVSASEDKRGLLIAAKLNLDIERGRQAYHGLKEGYLAFSIGYKPVKYHYEGKVRHLTEIALAEGSAVTFAMNPEARALQGQRP